MTQGTPRLRWLQFGTIDFETGPGGAEMHVRCVTRELRARGHEVVISHDPRALELPWDIVHTHGSVVPERGIVLPEGTRRIHTLHGSTWQRMRACREWFWLGGYRAMARERRAFREADGILSIHDRLPHFLAAGAGGKPARVCGNGWDASRASSENAPHAPSPRVRAVAQRAAGRALWLFIGRGTDIVKGADLLQDAIRNEPRLKECLWAAVPGDGFTETPALVHSGVLSADEIQELLNVASGLVIPSRYEGLPLVALEALAQGTPVVAHAVGGLLTLSPQLQGLQLVPVGDCPSLARAVVSASLPSAASPTSERAQRREHNRSLLKTWGQVAIQAEALALELCGASKRVTH